MISLEFGSEVLKMCGLWTAGLFKLVPSQTLREAWSTLPPREYTDYQRQRHRVNMSGSGNLMSICQAEITPIFREGLGCTAAFATTRPELYLSFSQ